MADIGIGNSQTTASQTTADMQAKKSNKGIDTTTVSNAVGKKETKDGNTLDKDAFLQLLVAQMQYQDPLEPTSNTEYMSQMAQFSSVEQMQNLNASYANGQAMNLTGQYVILNVPDSAGNITQVNGLVDYVTLQDGKTFFHIGDDYYDSSYLDSVVSLDYLEYLSRTKDPADTAGKTEETENNVDNDEENDKTDGTESA